MFGSSHDDSRDRERDPGGDGYGGSGSDRDDTPFASAQEESFMPMTRRDAPSIDEVNRLYSHALRDTNSFLKTREAHAKSRGVGEQALTLGELFGGALLGGYLSQRFRATSGAVPTGLLLGGIGFGAAQFTQMFGKYSEDVKNLSIGSALASAVIWAAGYGAVGAEKSQAKAEGNFPPATGATPQQLQQQWPTPAYQPAPSWGSAPYPAAVPQQPQQPSVADFQNLVMRGE